MVTTGHNDKVRRKQEQLYYTAKRNLTLKFNALYGLLLWEPWLENALYQVLSNTGAKTPGVDGVTGATLKDLPDQQTLLHDLRTALKDGTYRPKPVRRVYIPKAQGGKRPLGIPTIRDRVVQAAVKGLLEPIYEASFEDCSYGFRPNRGCWDALAEIGQYLKRPSDYEWVIEGDIQDCFGSIDHKILMRELRKRIGDRRLLQLIWHLLRAGVLEDLHYYRTDIGTPQGGICSPLLANIYMHQLDEWAARHSHRLTQSARQWRRRSGYATIRLTRYADDFVITVKGTREQAETIKVEVAEFLHTTMGMKLSHEKTHITHRTDRVTFLGIEVYYGPAWGQRNADGRERCNVYFLPSPKAITRYKDKVRELTDAQNSYVSDVEVIRAINRFSIGWANYYRHGNSAKLFSNLDNWTWHHVFRWLCHRHNMRPRAAYQRFHVAAHIPINRHPKRKAKRLGAWDGQEQHLAIWPLSFVPIKYWRYRGTRIPQRYSGDWQGKEPTNPPDYHITPLPDVGENPRHTTEYRNIREVVRLRDRFRCQWCHSRITQGSEVHHRDGNPHNHALDNLILLCQKCHRTTKTKRS